MPSGRGDTLFAGAVIVVRLVSCFLGWSEGVGDAGTRTHALHAAQVQYQPRARRRQTPTQARPAPPWRLNATVAPLARIMVLLLRFHRLSKHRNKHS